MINTYKRAVCELRVGYELLNNLRITFLEKQKPGKIAKSI